MKSRHNSRRIITACCWLAAAVAFFAVGGWVLEGFERLNARFRVRLGEHLLERHDIIFLADMDGPHVADATTQVPLHVRECARTPGRHGDARRIDLDRDAFMRIDLARQERGHKASFAAWFRPAGVSRRQVLFSRKSHEDGFALFLEDGELTLQLCSTSGESRVSCPYVGAAGRMTHVAVTFTRKTAVLYQNGKATLTVPLANPVGQPAKPLIYGRSTFWPFEGDIDDLAIWRRALDAGEVAAIARSRRGLAALNEPLLASLCGATGWLSRNLASFYRVFDRLAASGRETAGLSKGIPMFAAWPSASDERHFLAAHAASCRDGARTKKGANFRKVNVAYAGRLLPMEVALDDAYGAVGTHRMAFVVRDVSHALFGGSGLVRVYPPELHAELHPDAPYPLPLSATFIRLYFGNVFRGLYVLEPFDRVGGAWMAYGSHVGSATNSVGYRSPPSDCDEPPEGVSAEDAFQATASLVASDVFFPWSRQETKARVRARRRAWNAQGFDAQGTDASATARHILGGNVSPLYVTEDLDLSGDSGIRWESSDPDVVSAAGKVTRPEEGAPRTVLLTPGDGGPGSKEPIRVRVIPRRPTLQTLFLHIGAPVDKFSRSDFSCLRMPAGGGEGEWLTGTAAAGGGLHHRGNTSYVKGAKRSLSLKFDAPARIMDDGLPSRHLLLMSGYSDPTRLRNRVSFDAFRAAAAGRRPSGITAIGWAEVFINGEYFGVWEIAHRVRDMFGADEGLLYKIRSHDPQLWDTTSAEMAEAVTPADWRADTARPLEDLFAGTVGAKWESFAEKAGEIFDIESVIDYFLILNFTENYDGQVVNQFLGRDAAGGRWFVVPWDYDKTFFGKDVHLANTLVTHCVRDVPEFRKSAVAKWRTLRAGALSDEAVISRIDADAARLAPYMEEEYRLLKPAGWDGDFPGAVETLKKGVRARLKVVDEYLR